MLLFFNTHCKLSSNIDRMGIMLIDINMMFREASLNGFQVIERIRFCDSPREITKKYKCKSYCSCYLHVV